MAGYYDQLEDQLARATTRGAPGRRRVARPQLPRARWSWLAAAATVAVCVGVSLVIIIGARSNHHNGPTTVPHHVHAPLPVIHNYAPGKVPPLGGTLVCNATLVPTRRARPARGTMIVHTGSGASNVFSLTAAALKPAPAGDRYEVWVRAGTNQAVGGFVLERGVKPTLLGVVEPSVTADGLIAAKGTIPSDLTGSYRVLVTVQRRGAKSPGRVVLRADNVPL